MVAHLWSGGESDAKAVHTALGSGGSVTNNTIRSTLKRLFEEDPLKRDKVSQAHVNRASVSREEIRRGLLGELVGELTHVRPTPSSRRLSTSRSGPDSGISHA